MSLMRRYRVRPCGRRERLQKSHDLIVPLHRREVHGKVTMRVLHAGISVLASKVLHQVHGTAVGRGMEARLPCGPLEVGGHPRPEEAHHGVGIPSAYRLVDGALHPLFQDCCAVSVPGDDKDHAAAWG